MRDHAEVVKRAGDRVGGVLREKWRLDALLGVGGMAAVYAATHRAGKRVAVKIMHRELLPNDEARRRFLREAYVANQVQHPDAVSVLDDDVAEDGCLFLVMELLEGETVHQYWTRRDKNLDVERLLWIVDRLLDVLISAQARKIVHRDIKPENLFMTRDGALKVLDFGFARLLEGAPGANKAMVKRLTMRGIVVGTPAFMSPEHAAAEVEIDGRSDIWSVGATMFTLLTGRHVHEGATPFEQFESALQKRAPSLRQLRPDLPSTLIAAVDRALAFERDARWRDAADMRQALRRVRVDNGTQASLPRLYDEDDELSLDATELHCDKNLASSATPSGALRARDAERQGLAGTTQERSGDRSKVGPTAIDYVNRGVTFFEKGDIGHALRDFGAAIDLDPRCALAFFDRGILRQSLGHHFLAINDYASAIRIDPTFAAAWYNRAVAELAVDHRRAARSDACRAFALYRDRGDADGAERARRLVGTIDQQSD